ncbi:MAG: hypothetical protein ACO2ZM_06040 [Francisellaceae bacterium]
MKQLLILVDDTKDWMPYYPTDNLMTVTDYTMIKPSPCMCHWDLNL